MARFLCIGECMVELSSAGEGLWRQGFAGDVLNTAWYARAYLSDEWQVQFHTGLGCDRASDEMIRFIEDAGISCGDIPRFADKMPGLYAIHLDGAERSFSYWRDTSAARSMLRQPDLLWDKVSQADVIYLSGITLGILTAEDANLLMDGLVRHRQASAVIAFDPNIRPRLWPDEAQMKSTISRMGGVADIVLPSFDDEVETFGDASPEATAQRYQALGAGQVVVKNGKSATLVTTDHTTQSFPVTPVPGVIDTTAAGDSFAGAYLAEYVQSGDVAAAVRAGQACAARVVCTKGALVPFAELNG